MRRGDIEERMIRIEKSLRDLQAGQRETSDTILAALRSVQATLIEEKMESMRQQLGREYQRLLLDLLLSTAQRELARVCPDPCSLYDRQECLDFFHVRLKEFGEHMGPDEAERFIAAQVEHDQDMMSRYPEHGRDLCQACFQAYVRERDHLIDAIRDMNAARHALLRRNHDLLIAEMPDEKVLSSIIEPLSHPVRFAMIKALSGGSMSYSELSALTGFKGGHLLFHVARLVEAGLVMKSGTSGLYTLTEKGMGVMGIIRSLYCC